MRAKFGALIIFVMAVIGPFLGSSSVWSAEAGKGKIAVATESDAPAAAKVSSQAGFSAFFLLFDSDGAFLEALKNPVQNAGMGTGTAVVDFLATQGSR